MSERDQQTDVAGALRLLATAEPPAGMEQRLLRRLREAERALEVAPQRPWQQWLVAGAAICLLVMTAMVPVWRSHLAPPTRRLERNEAMASSAALQSETERLLRSQPEHPVGRRLHVPRRYDQRAQEVSFPAPPAPLTQQEQLLVQVSEARTPAEGVAKQALLHEEPAQVPGEQLPSLPRDVPGHPLPTLAAEAPGHPLPNFFETLKTGDQP